MFTASTHRKQPSNSSTFGRVNNATVQPKPMPSAACLSGRQGRLEIGQPNDRYEQEADAMADRVMGHAGTSDKPNLSNAGGMVQNKEEEEVLQMFPNSSRPTIQMMHNNEEDDESLQMSPLSPSLSLQMKCDQCEEEESKLQMQPLIQQSANGKTHASPALSSQLNSTKGSGEPLSENTRSFMESGFGTDFKDIKIHDNNKAAEMSRGIGARAFTHGNDIYFNKGQYNPESSSGKHLLAHELTHTIQQGNEIRRLSIKPTPGKSFHKGKCGERSVHWNFESGVAAPLAKPATKTEPAKPGGGYIIQQVDLHKDIKDCPSNVNSTPIAPYDTFWEAWWVAPGDTIQKKHKDGIVDYTDRSARPASEGIDKSGSQVSRGEVKFFTMVTTGDLGKEDVLSADPVIASDWKPGTKGGVSLAGWLPSTKKKPSWWGSQADGPKHRFANSYWNCCNADDSKNWSESDADPKP